MSFFPHDVVHSSSKKLFYMWHTPKVPYETPARQLYMFPDHEYVDIVLDSFWDCFLDQTHILRISFLIPWNTRFHKLNQHMDCYFLSSIASK